MLNNIIVYNNNKKNTLSIGMRPFGKPPKPREFMLKVDTIVIILESLVPLTSYPTKKKKVYIY